MTAPAGHNILNSTTWGGALMSCVAALRDTMGGMTLNDWVAVIGVSMAVFGAVTNYVFKRRADLRERRAEQREIAEHLARIQG